VKRLSPILSEPDTIRQVTEQTGEIDSLVNSAVIAILEPFLKTTVEAWDKTMAVNLRSVMIISQVIAKQMIKRGIAALDCKRFQHDCAPCTS
jgi:NAD(P)-dependent dehydrogenase (short-subunit alcohol dehydrogenase family)